MNKNKNSLVAYFDILGYQSFLKSNSALETAEKVFRIVKEAPKEACAEWESFSKIPKVGGEWKKMLDSLQSLVFSDTIVISCPIPESGPDHRHIALIGGIASDVAKKMFESGLPVRGVITFGSFIFDGTCIAGRAIVDAYTLCQKLDLAGVAFTPKLNEHIDAKEFKKAREQVLDEVYPHYLFPLKDGSELKTRAATWGCEKKTNFTTAVREAFWKWNKDIPCSVDSKVHNTAKMLDFFGMHFQNVNKAQEKSSASKK